MDKNKRTRDIELEWIENERPYTDTTVIQDERTRAIQWLTLVEFVYWLVSRWALLIVIVVPLVFIVSLGHAEVENAWAIPIVIALFFLLRHYKRHLEYKLDTEQK